MLVDIQQTWIYISSILYPVLFAAFFSLLLTNIKCIKTHFAGIRKSAWLAIVMLVIASFWLRHSVAPASVEYTSPAWEFVVTGKNIAETGLAKRCDGGIFSACLFENPIAHPAGYSYFLASLFLIFGQSLEVASAIQGILASLTAVPIFLAMYLVTKKEGTSIICSSFFSVMPLHALLSMELSIGMATVGGFFESVALLLLFIALEERTNRTAYLAVLGLAMSLSFVMQNILLYPIALLFYVCHGKGPRLKTLYTEREKTIRLLLVATASAFIPVFIVVYYWLLKEGLVFTLFSPANFLPALQQLSRMLLYFFMPHTVIFLVSSAILFLKRSAHRTGIVFLVWFASFTVLYLFFLYGPNQRYMMSVVLPFAIVCGVGSSAIISFFTGEKRFYTASLIFSVAFILLSVPLIQNKKLAAGPSMNDLVYVISEVHRDSVILIPTLNTLWGTYFFFTDRPMHSFLTVENIDFSKSVYFVRTGLCKKDQFQRPCNYLQGSGASFLKEVQ